MSKTEVVADFVTGERSLPGWQLCPFTVSPQDRGRQREKKLSGISFGKVTEPIMRVHHHDVIETLLVSQMFHLQMPSH